MAKSSRSAWFIIRGEKRFGPYTSDDLREYVTQGRLTPEDLIWKEGLAEPVKAAKVGNLGFEARGASGKSDPAVAPVENASRLVDISRITRPEPKQEPRQDSNDLLDNLEVIEDAPSGDKSSRKKRSKKKEQVGAGGAIALAVGRGFSSLGEFFNHPLRHSFLLLVLLVACGLAAAPVLTVILVPAFFMGYIHCIDGMLKGEKGSISRFLSFLRHGWDSFWHLLMMHAAMLLLAAMAIAPAVIAAILFAGTFGTASFGLMEIASHVSLPEARVQPEKREAPGRMPAGQPEKQFQPQPNKQAENNRFNNRDDARNRFNNQRPNNRNKGMEEMPEIDEPEPDRPVRRPDWRPSSDSGGPGFFERIMDAVFSLGQTVAMVILIILVGAGICLVLTPLASAMVLLFCLVYRVALGSGQTDQKFDLVYNALDATIQVATGAWGRILASGLWICGLPLLTYVLTIVLGLVFAKMGLYSLSLWMGSIVTPILGFLLMGHLGIFLVMTARDLTTEEG